MEASRRSRSVDRWPKGAYAEEAKSRLAAPKTVAEASVAPQVVRLPVTVAAGITITAAMLVVALPCAALAALVVAQAPGILQGLQESPVLARLDALSVCGGDVGLRIRELGDQLVGWHASNALVLVGNLTRTVLNLVIALFGAYFLFLKAGVAWSAMRPFIPFWDDDVQRLRKRFSHVTNSTVIGVVLVAVAQGARRSP